MNITANKLVTCGDVELKIHSLRNLEEVEKVITINEEDKVKKVSWSTDGSMLAVTTDNGNILVYLTEVARLSSVYRKKIAILSSLNEVSIFSQGSEKV